MIGAVFPAAGEGKRMGSLKQLLPWEKDRTLAQVSLENLLESKEIDGPVRVVLGAGAERIERKIKKISDRRIQIRFNPDYQEGLLSSIRTGLRDLPRETEAFFVALADQPFIPGKIYDVLARTFREEKASIIVPVYRGKRGHPVLFSTCFLPEIERLPIQSEGLKILLNRYPGKIRVCTVMEEGIIRDIDYPADYKRFREDKNEK